MAFEGLTEKLTSVFNKLRGKGHLSEADVKEAMREIRLALLEADVSYKVVKDVIKTVTKVCGGSGGGKPDSAMGGGKDVLKVDDALATVDDFVASKLG